jgi:hypothetical protein
MQPSCLVVMNAEHKRQKEPAEGISGPGNISFDPQGPPGGRGREGYSGRGEGRGEFGGRGEGRGEIGGRGRQEIRGRGEGGRGRGRDPRALPQRQAPTSILTHGNVPAPGGKDVAGFQVGSCPLLRQKMEGCMVIHWAE